MTQIRSLLIGTALSAALTTFTAAGAFAQTTAQPDAAAAGQQMTAPAADTAAPAAQGVAPAPQRLTATGSTDPLVQKRDADAKANAEYSASKKASKQQLKEQQAAAKSQYKEQVRDAKLNKKADKQTANNEMKMNMQGQTPAQDDGSDVKH
ncbi:hypothetical protein [Paraburkholderia phenazinium]|jgi:hypothetical protein|uniref:Uncharacterized protein n=1 Tax=Paraburkholderia phenazinium TaxID=60549 RepID=A0A1G7VUR8_9BURK|nr:hypothetical protein [Paraburkholderia phenazinium]SDG63321.1 hypothetical protein SAMN05216466_104249 [Paraburkholderia phenazinium]